MKAEVREGNHWATLKVSSRNSILLWSFPGPDGRYNWGHAEVPVDKFPQLRSATVSAFREWSRLRKVAPSGVTVSKNFREGEFDFKLNVGGWHNGVIVFNAMHAWRDRRLESEDDLKTFLSLLDAAEKLSIQLRELL